ncbi:glycosyltransferase, partial [Paractinoplanes globisporus]
MPPSPLNPATIRHRRPSPSVSVVIPVRDPGGLPLMLRGLPPVDEVIVVCEGPTTETAAVVRSARPDARVLRPGRPGAGNALATGLAASSCDVVVTLNGDGSTDPGEIPRYVDALTGGADVVLGSRYREGGRDLTGGRFRRWANLLLIWIVNTVFGTDRTDPGFGYTAFWRDALERLDLPDPSPRAGAARTDGPELFPLLTLRPAVLGLRVAEVGSVAYPRMSRPARADRPTLTHWLRVMAGELRGRRGRHSDARADGDPSTRPSSGPSTRPSSQPSSRLSAQLSAQPDGPAARAGSTRPDGSAARTGFGPRWGLGARLAAADAHGETTQDQASTRPGRPASDRRSKGEPLWGPPSRRLAPARDLWQAGENPISHTSPRSIANLTPHAWRSGYPGRVGARAIDLPDPAAGPGSAGTSGPGKADTSDSATADASGLGGTDPSSPGDTSASGLGGTDASGGTGVSGPGGA